MGLVPEVHRDVIVTYYTASPLLKKIMTTIHELRNPIDVRTPKGYAKCIAWIDYGVEINTLWKCRMHETGKVINFYDDQIEIYPNPINEEPPLADN